MKNILASPFGTFIKSFAATVLSQYLIELQHGQQLFTWNIGLVQDLATAGLVSCLPILINWFNPAYTGYGVGKDA